MQRNTLIFLFLLLTGSQLFSQNVGFGIRGGFNYSTPSLSKIFTSPGPDEIDSVSPTGTSYGVFLELKAAKSFFIQPEFNVVQKELSSEISDLGEQSIKTALVTNNFEVPILAKVKLGPQILNLTLFAGPNFEYSRSQFSEKTTTLKGETSNEQKPGIKRIEIDSDSYDPYGYSNIAGFGVNIKTNNMHIFADYRYNFDFKNLDTVRHEGFIQSLGSNLGVGIAVLW